MMATSSSVWLSMKGSSMRNDLGGEVGHGDPGFDTIAAKEHHHRVRRAAA